VSGSPAAEKSNAGAVSSSTALTLAPTLGRLSARAAPSPASAAATRLAADASDRSRSAAMRHASTSVSAATGADSASVATSASARMPLRPQDVRGGNVVQSRWFCSVLISPRSLDDTGTAGRIRLEPVDFAQIVFAPRCSFDLGRYDDRSPGARYVPAHAISASPRSPSRRITIAAGQNAVNACWIRFAPLKTVSQTKPECTEYVSTTDSSTMSPANADTPRSTEKRLFSTRSILVAVLIFSPLELPHDRSRGFFILDISKLQSSNAPFSTSMVRPARTEASGISTYLSRRGARA